MLQKDVDGREVKAGSLKNIRVCQGSRETKSKTINVKKEGGVLYKHRWSLSLRFVSYKKQSVNLLESPRVFWFEAVPDTQS